LEPRHNIVQRCRFGRDHGHTESSEEYAGSDTPDDALIDVISPPIQWQIGPAK
jgi:hypothetical protein